MTPPTPITLFDYMSALTSPGHTPQPRLRRPGYRRMRTLSRRHHSP